MQIRRYALPALLPPFPNYLGVGVGIAIGVDKARLSARPVTDYEQDSGTGCCA